MPALVRLAAGQRVSAVRVAQRNPPSGRLAGRLVLPGVRGAAQGGWRIEDWQTPHPGFLPRAEREEVEARRQVRYGRAARVPIQGGGAPHALPGWIEARQPPAARKNGRRSCRTASEAAAAAGLSTPTVLASEMKGEPGRLTRHAGANRRPRRDTRTESDCRRARRLTDSPELPAQDGNERGRVRAGRTLCVSRRRADATE